MAVTRSLLVLLVSFTVFAYAAVQPYAPSKAAASCCGARAGSSGIVQEVEPNNNMQQAMNLECYNWVQKADKDVEFSARTINSPRFSWITVNATGDGTVDWYSFTTPTFVKGFALGPSWTYPNGKWSFVVDIDYADKADGSGFDSYINLFNGTVPVTPDVQFYAKNDDNGYEEDLVRAYSENSGGSSVPVTVAGGRIIHLDSFSGGLMEKAQGVTYYVKVSANTGARSQTDDALTGPIPAGKTYRLSISMAYHAWAGTTYPSPSQVAGSCANPSRDETNSAL